MDDLVLAIVKGKQPLGYGPSGVYLTNVSGLEIFTSQVSTTASISSLLGSYADESESSAEE
jgi:hypothetical protein